MGHRLLALAIFLTVAPIAYSLPIKGTVPDPMPGTGSWTTIPNGGFELGTMDFWTDRYAYRGVCVVEDATSFRGQYSSRVDTLRDFTGPPGWATVCDPILVLPDTTYVLSGFFNVSDMQGGAVYLDLWDTPFDVHVVVKHETTKWRDNFEGRDWGFMWHEFTTSPTTTSLYVRMVRDSGPVTAGDDVFLDEIAVTLARDFRAPITIPEPGSVLLVAVGIAAMLLLGRRRLH